MAPQMWITSGGRFGVWVPCPQSPFESGSEGVSEETQLLNGGAFVYRSAASRRKYDFTWKGTKADLQPVKDLYDGVYGRGPFYFIDPAAVNNVLPPHWAYPSLSGGNNWPALIRDTMPVIAETTISSVYKPPPFMATYALPAAVIPVFDAATFDVLVPIPPNATLNLRVWGAVTGTAVVQLRQTVRATGAVVVQNVTPSATGANASVAGATYSHIELWLTKTSTASSTVTLAGMVAKLGSAPTVITAGEGNSGVQFTGALGNTTYQAYDPGYKAMSLSASEVGAWGL